MPADPSLLGVYFLDVGQGDCTFVVPPSGQGAPILFDCADAYAAQRFVANHGIRDLRSVVASHLDADHVRGLLPFLRTHFADNRKVDRLVLFADRVPVAGRNCALRELVATALAWEREPPHEGFVLKGNHRDGEGPLLLAEGTDWRVELVLPWAGAVSQAIVAGGDDPNACSAVLRVSRGGTAILIGGDAPLASWERLEPDLRPARVIRVPHHGGEIREGGSAWTRFNDLYDAVGADLSVVSVGTRNPYGHPFEGHAAAAHRGHQCRLLCTQLTPRCHDTPASLRGEALLYAGGVEWPYRHRVEPGHPSRRPPEEVPCAGTVVAWLDGAGQVDVEPARGADHDRLLRRVDHPLCRP
jgi:beta-lactamase superfamily II metal-dependent hydrolase